MFVGSDEHCLERQVLGETVFFILLWLLWNMFPAEETIGAFLPASSCYSRHCSGHCGLVCSTTREDCCIRRKQAYLVFKNTLIMSLLVCLGKRVGEGDGTFWLDVPSKSMSQ